MTHFRGVFALNARAPLTNTRLRPLGAASCAAAVAGTALLVSQSAGSQHRLQLPHLGWLKRPRLSSSKRKLRLSWLVVDALSGAVGEIAQLAVLYPLDTIKVRCQAQGANAGVILRELRAMGPSMRTLRTLYAGMGSSALCSAVIGAFYLLAFYTVKRVGGEAAGRWQRRQAAGAAAAGAAAAAAGGSESSESRGSGRRLQQTTGSQLADGSSARPPLNVEGTHPLVASLAGISASVIASVFEAPMETFKLRAQAGAISSGSMLAAMTGTALAQGLGALYWSYGAFMIKSLPYDFAELVTYSGMCDLREAAAQRAQQQQQQQQQQQRGRGGGEGGWRERLGSWLASSPDGMGDMVVGAAAGAAAVFASMPFDVVKTHMDLHHHHRPCPPGANAALHAITEFGAVGRQLVAQGGPGALFVGTTPRLLQTMPSTMVYWFAVEGTRRTLMKFVDVDGAAPQQAQAAPALPPAAA